MCAYPAERGSWHVLRHVEDGPAEATAIVLTDVAAHELHHLVELPHPVTLCAAMLAVHLRGVEAWLIERYANGLIRMVCHRVPRLDHRQTQRCSQTARLGRRYCLVRACASLPSLVSPARLSTAVWFDRP